MIITDERLSDWTSLGRSTCSPFFDSHQHTFVLRLEIIVLVMYYHRNIITLKKILPSLSVIAQRIKGFHNSTRTETESHVKKRAERISRSRLYPLLVAKPDQIPGLPSPSEMIFCCGDGSKVTRASLYLSLFLITCSLWILSQTSTFEKQMAYSTMISKQKQQLCINEKIRRAPWRPVLDTHFSWPHTSNFPPHNSPKSQN